MLGEDIGVPGLSLIAQYDTMSIHLRTTQVGPPHRSNNLDQMTVGMALSPHFTVSMAGKRSIQGISSIRYYFS